MQNRNIRRCEICFTDVHRASFDKHLRIIKHSQNLKALPSNFFTVSNESNITKHKNYNPELLKEAVGEKSNDKQLNKGIAKK